MTTSPALWNIRIKHNSLSYPVNEEMTTAYGVGKELDFGVWARV